MNVGRFSGFGFILLVTLLFVFNGCRDEKIASIGSVNIEEVPTVTSTNLNIVNYKDSIPHYKFVTPLMEHFSLVELPYMLFKEGIYMEIYNSESGEIETMLDADYARYEETEKVWEAKGNVVGKSSDGKILYTEQIFWDEDKARVYSNVQTKVVDGEEVTIGSGFESDDKLENIEFKQTIGRILIDTAKTNNSVDVDEPESAENKTEE